MRHLRVAEPVRALPGIDIMFLRPLHLVALTLAAAGSLLLPAGVTRHLPPAAAGLHNKPPATLAAQVPAAAEFATELPVAEPSPLAAGPQPASVQDTHAVVGSLHSIHYHAGRVLQDASYLLLFAGAVEGDRAQMAAFSRAMVGDGYLDGLRGYGVARVSFAGVHELAPVVHTDTVAPSGGNTLTPHDIEAWLLGEVEHGDVPAPDGNTVIGITLPSRQRVADGSPYHAEVNGIIYTVLPLPALPGFWQTSSSHELVEALTDPINQTGWSSDELDSSGSRFELADVCNGHNARFGERWLIATYYVPVAGCVAGAAPDAERTPDAPGDVATTAAPQVPQ